MFTYVKIPKLKQEKETRNNQGHNPLAKLTISYNHVTLFLLTLRKKIPKKTKKKKKQKYAYDK